MNAVERVARSSRALLWAARITGGLIVAVLGFVVVVNVVGPTAEALPQGWEWFGLAMFPVGVLVGYALAFWRPTAGGIAALACLAVWLVYVGFATGVLFVAAIVAVPGVLYIIHAVNGRQKKEATS